MTYPGISAFLCAVLLLMPTPLNAAPTTQRASAFYPPQLLERIRTNVGRDEWGKGIRQRAIELAEPWKKMSDAQLRKLMFGSTIPRSWMVWSNGHCPSCKKPVPMYDWQI